MKRIMLDTNVLIRFLKGEEPFAPAIISADEVLIHPTVLAEFLCGIDEKVKRGRETRQKIDAFLAMSAVKVVTLTTKTSVFYSKVFKYLKSKGDMIPQNDIWIAASALENGYELATHDAHFEKIPMLSLVL